MTQLILDLTKKFEIINQLLEVKNDAIIENYHQDCNQIESKLTLNDHANFLNEYRQCNLDQLVEKRNSQLAKINELKEESMNDIGLFMEMVEASIKPNNLYFKKSHSSLLYNLFLNKVQFKSVFDFIKIIKYYNFIFKQNKIKLNITDTYKTKTINGITGFTFYILPNSHILLWVYIKKRGDRLIIVDKNSNLKHSKKIRQKN
jgi:hypothetical protein